MLCMVETLHALVLRAEQLDAHACTTYKNGKGIVIRRSNIIIMKLTIPCIHPITADVHTERLMDKAEFSND